MKGTEGCKNDVCSTGNLKSIPPEDRPREKMLLRGASALTDAELIAVLLGTGTVSKSALAIGMEMTCNEGLYRKLARITEIRELMRVKGLGKAKAATVLAALEIGRRIATVGTLEKIRFSSPQDGADYLMPRLRYSEKEKFAVILLNTKNQIITSEIVSEGTLTASVVHPREVFYPAILRHAAAVVVAHNHPSGDPSPSAEDEDVTAMLGKAGSALGIPLLDHLIIGDGTYYSFREHGSF
ncbi:MAG: DNA repair protein RadC [Acidaminococcaceae bacterium]|nr:DNA repair protein RadC [Acidaminococcaceae bacterium]